MKRAVYTTIIALLAAGSVACASNGRNTGNQTTGGSGNDGDSASSAVPAVYMIEEINPENLVRIYEVLGRESTGKVAVKISTGEPGGHNFLQPSLIKDLVQKVDGTIVECNTAYGGGRANTEAHLKAAEDHGFTAIADVDIMDSEGEVRLPVEGGSHIGYDIVGSHYLNYDFTIILSHFKGHAMAGFGGAIKNMSIGIASSNGKRWIHSGGTSTGSWGNPTQEEFLETMPRLPRPWRITAVTTSSTSAWPTTCQWTATATPPPKIPGWATSASSPPSTGKLKPDGGLAYLDVRLRFASTSLVISKLISLRRIRTWICDKIGDFF